MNRLPDGKSITASMSIKSQLLDSKCIIIKIQKNKGVNPMMYITFDNRSYFVHVANANGNFVVAEFSNREQAVDYVNTCCMGRG